MKKTFHLIGGILLAVLLLGCSNKGISPESISASESKQEESSESEILEPDPEDIEMTKGDRLYSEMWRPQFHYSDPDSWLNDPNGLVYADGVWHMYYQATPHSNQSGAKYWGHAISKDLVHWEFIDYPLKPDATGDMWSGGAVADPENLSGFFDNTDKTGIIAAYSTHKQTIGFAYSDDGGMTFNKFSTSAPVIKNPGANDFRDPCLFYYPEEEKWKVAIAGGYLRIYESDNLYDWTLCSTSSTIQTECPCLFRMTIEDTGEEKWVLTCSSRGYYVGNFDGQKFTPETGYIEMNSGLDSYAGLVFNDAPNNRVIMLNWMSSIVTQSWDAEGIWNQQMTIPLEFKLYTNGSGYVLKQNPVSELNKLREKVLLDIKNKDANGIDVLKDIKSNTFEMELKVDLSQTKNFDLVLASDGMGTDEIRITYEKSTRKLILDRSKNKYGPDVLTKVNNKFGYTISAKTIVDNILELHLYFDVNCLELFVNGGSRYIPMKCNPFTSSKGMSLTGENLYIKELKVYEMRSIWFNYKENIDGVHIADSSLLYVPLNGTGSLEVASFNGKELTAESLNPELLSASIDGNMLNVSGLTLGTGKVQIKSGMRYKELEVNVYDPEVIRLVNMLGELETNNATISESPFGLNMSTAGGDGFAISKVNVSDFTYSAKVVLNSGTAAALIFRAHGTTDFYCFNVDYGGHFYKLWKRVGNSFTDLKVINDGTINLNKEYELKAICQGNSIKCYVNGSLKIDITDSSHSNGYLGLNVYNCNATFNDIIYE